MLVLSRLVGQSIDLSNGVRITVTKIKGGTVRLGIDAPDDVDIVRSELLEMTQAGAAIGDRVFAECSHESLP